MKKAEFYVSKKEERAIKIIFSETGEPSQMIYLDENYVPTITLFNKDVRTFTITIIDNPELYFVEGIKKTQTKDPAGAIFQSRQAIIAATFLNL